MSVLLYVFGVPGAGKSTLMEELTKDYKPFSASHGIVKYMSYPGPDVIELGVQRPEARGTDGLSMAVQPEALAFLDWVANASQHTVAMAEGDRLANARFFEAVLDLGIRLELAYLQVSPEIAEERRLMRQDKLHTKAQDPAWVRGRFTKVARLYDEWITRARKGVTAIELFGWRPPHELAGMLAHQSYVARRFT